MQMFLNLKHLHTSYGVFLKNSLHLFIYFNLFMYKYHDACVHGHLEGTSSLLPPSESQRSNSGSQPCWQAPQLAHISH